MTTIADCEMNHNSEQAVDNAAKHRQRCVREQGDSHHQAPAALCAWVLAAICTASSACSIAPPQADNARALSDIDARRAGVEEVVEGSVIRVLTNSHGPSGVHERFVVDVRGGATSIPLYVTDNISVGAVAPLRRGDHVVVKGELAFNEYGPLLHWTHRDPRLRHAPGFVEVGGHVYE
jgi:hypothetical protein